jgi:hypothetical protein
MKKVLVIAYSFPPVKNAGAARSAEFVGQLTNYGWEPLVLTHTVHADINKDIAMQVPEDIDVIRTSAWEPENLPGILQPIGKALSSMLIPDAERLWELFSVHKAVRMAKYAGVDMIYTVSPPSSSHLIGLRLKKKYPGVPWVADVCDPLPGTSRKIREHFDRKLKNQIMIKADCVISGSKETYDKLLAENETDRSQETLCYVPSGNAQLLSEQFEKACRVIAARKIIKSNEEQ